MIRRTSASAVPRQLNPGRPRKLTHQRIIEAALQVLEDHTFSALTMRALAQRLGVNHATLYNYVGHIEDIEAEALQTLMARVPVPSAANPAPMREQLIEHLLAVRDLQLQHPHVLHAPVRSPAWKLHLSIIDRVLHALTQRGQPLTDAALAYDALVALVAHSAEHARVNRLAQHPDFVELQQGATASLPPGDLQLVRRVLAMRSRTRVDSLAEILGYFIDRLLPGIERQGKKRGK